MRLFVILLVSFVVQATSQLLKINCGDETCERPSNRAVTTLKYVPDKPYKLKINSVNSEVEIFGMTDDLFYIRHGKNYGFYPKNYLREKNKGVFPFVVEIDITSRKIDQQVREQNFLHEFLKSSQPVQPQQLNVNETKSELTKNETLPAPVNEPSQEKIVEPIPTDKPLDIPLNKQSEAKSEEAKLVSAEIDEDENDSGIDEDDEDEDDEEEDEDSEEEQQPELVAIPPGKDTDKQKAQDSSNEISKEEKPLALPVAASSVQEIPTVQATANDIVNETVPEPPIVVEHVPEFIPIKADAVVEAENFLDAQNETLNPTPKAPAVVQNEIKVVENILVPEVATEKPVEMVKVEETIPQVVSNKVEEPVKVEEPIKALKIEDPVKVEEPIKAKEPAVKIEDPVKVEEPIKAEEPAVKIEDPVKVKEPIKVEEQGKVEEPIHQPTENISQLPIFNVQEKIPEVQVVNEIPKVEVTTEIPALVEVTTEVFTPVESVPEIPAPVETTTETQFIPPPTLLPLELPAVTEVPQTIEDPQPIVVQPEALPLQQLPPAKPEPDALLQIFNEKLGIRGVEGTGKGSVEPLHRHDNHHNKQHDSHDHNHHGHDHGHAEHHHEEKAPEIQEEKASEPPRVVEGENEKPGFFGGLFKKFFSDEDDSEQHFHDQAKAENNAFNPTTEQIADSGFCEKLDSENCPKLLMEKRDVNYANIETSKWKSTDEYIRIILNEAIDSMDLIISMSLTALTVLIFTLGYYCINKARKEGPLIAKMNELERHLMATTKENDILKTDVITTKQKLMSIEDNSFGSNDMVIALKQELEKSEQIKYELSEKIVSLEKELEAAAEDGLELNRMVSELLNNQSGSESIISSVEELQRQLNEQQETIMTMNETLAAKSRENSELQIQLSEIKGKFHGEFENLQQQIDAVALERTNLQIELENLKRDSDIQVNQLIEERNGEVTRLNSELTSYAKNYEETKKSLNSAEAKVQALEECLKAVKKDSKGAAFKDLFDVAELKADLLAVTKEKSTIQEQLQTEKDSRKLLDDRVKSISEEMSNLKKEFGIAEKEKLEAQTRLEVLSTYFKDKEMQLQQELSVKEARWMKQQGETTTTVEKVQALNDEIQGLKSQNDSLRAEIEAQVAAHKLNISSLEAQSHAAWLNARQAERKLEESRMESAALRRRLTSIAENPAGANDLINGIPGIINDTMNSIPSPIRVESPNNVNSLPPAPIMLPPFLPQGFLPGAPPPFLPPPPFMPGMNEMGPPLGRLMSPPPKRFTPTMRDDRDRYSPRSRGRYSPDSRYDDYTAFETETDYSPPPSPSPPRRGYNSPSDRSKKSKGNSSAGSLESNPTSRRK